MTVCDYDDFAEVASSAEHAGDITIGVAPLADTDSVFLPPIITGCQVTILAMAVFERMCVAGPRFRGRLRLTSLR